MTYRLIGHDPDLGSVRSLTFVAFLPDGECVAIPDGHGGVALTAAEHLRALGFTVTGSSHGRDAGRAATTAWLDFPDVRRFA